LHRAAKRNVKVLLLGLQSRFFLYPAMMWLCNELCCVLV